MPDPSPLAPSSLVALAPPAKPPSRRRPQFRLLGLLAFIGVFALYFALWRITIDKRPRLTVWTNPWASDSKHTRYSVRIPRGPVNTYYTFWEGDRETLVAVFIGSESGGTHAKYWDQSNDAGSVIPPEARQSFQEIRALATQTVDVSAIGRQHVLYLAAPPPMLTAPRQP